MMTNEDVLKLADSLCSMPAEMPADVWEDKLLRLLENALRTLHFEVSSAVGSLPEKALPTPEYPLVKAHPFPLSEELAPAAIFLTAYLAEGSSAAKIGYESAKQAYLKTFDGSVQPIVNRYAF